MKKKELTRERREELIQQARQTNSNWGLADALVPEQKLVWDVDLEPNDDADIAFDWYLHKCKGDYKKAFRIIWDEAEHAKRQLNEQTALVYEFLARDRKRNAGRKKDPTSINYVRAFLNSLSRNQRPTWGQFQKFCGIKGTPFKKSRFQEILGSLQ